MEKHTVKSYDAELLQLNSLINDMGKSTARMVSQAFEALVRRNSELAENVAKQDDAVDQMQVAVDELTIRILAKRQPLAVDLRVIFSGQKIAGNLERIGDYGVNIARHAEPLNRLSRSIELGSTEKLGQIALQMLGSVMAAYNTQDTELAVKVWHQDDELDATYTQILKDLTVMMAQNPDNIQAGATLLLVARCAERIGDLVTNIAESVYYIVHGNLYRGRLC